MLLRSERGGREENRTERNGVLCLVGDVYISGLFDVAFVKEEEEEDD